MTDILHLPPHLASTTLASPTCANLYSNKKELLHHLRTSSDEIHKTFRYDANNLAIEPTLLALGIFPCPRGCGAFFDGGTARTSRILERNIELAKCRDRCPGAAPLPRELDGPFMPTTTTGVTAALMAEVQEAASYLSLAPVNSASIAFCLTHVPAYADFWTLVCRCFALSQPQYAHLCYSRPS